MDINQSFIPKWNDIYANLITKVSKSLISASIYTSPFSKLVQNMEVGDYVEDIHINLAKVYLFDTIPNSDILSNHTDDIAVANYSNNVDLMIPSTYSEYVVRTSFTIVENVAQLITSLTANLRTTLEFWRTKLVKQALYNSYHYGMIDSVVIDDPRTSAENSGKFAVVLNSLVDDFRTEINNRYIPYNNQVGITEDEKRFSISKDIPYIIVFNDFIRSTEFLNAINLGIVGTFKGGNNNQDWQERLIKLNFLDFPTGIPTQNRSEVTGDTVLADDINFFEMPTNHQGMPLFSGEPTGGNTIIGYVLDVDVFKLYTQLEVMTTWLNNATLKTTNREIYRGTIDLGAFAKICAITINETVPSPSPVVSPLKVTVMETEEKEEVKKVKK